MTPDNPFFITARIPDPYFCDRKAETEQLIDYIHNGYNVVLKAPRRIGKSSLIRHLFQQPEIKSRYNTLYVDIFGSRDLSDFINEFQRAFLAAPIAKGEKTMKKIKAYFSNPYFSISDSLNGTPLPKIGFTAPHTVEYTLQEMFDVLEKTDKPNLVVFDEFQHIQNYPQRAAAILRSYTQQMNNTRFIYSGSSRHLLQTMFEVSGEPFYKSAMPMNLDIISLSAYREFCSSMFHLYKKEIDADAIDMVYNLFSGNTYDIQVVMKGTFAQTAPREKASQDTALSAIFEILENREQDFREKMNELDNQKERKTLYCIAREGLATGLTSSQMLKQYQLDNASSVQNALKNLCGDKLNLVSRVGKNHYRLQDRFFELWFAKTDGRFDEKISTAKDAFDKERALTGVTSAPPSQSI